MTKEQFFKSGDEEIKRYSLYGSQLLHNLEKLAKKEKI